MTIRNPKSEIRNPIDPLQTIATVVEQQPMARDTWRLRLRCPEIAQRIVPGQFFMVRAPGRNDPLLGRPFALYDVYEDGGEAVGVDFGYIAVGKLTRLMPHWKKGEAVELWGPLGNGFPAVGARHLLIVAGGIGQTPFLAVAREALRGRRYGCPPRETAGTTERVTLFYGVRSAEFFAGLDDFADVGVELHLATDDGSRGHHGYVTDLLVESLESGLWSPESGKPRRHGDAEERHQNPDGQGSGSRIRDPGRSTLDPEPSALNSPAVVFCCGPEPMMHATAAICADRGLPCWLSLETPMACGIGACFSCVTGVRTDDGDWDYRRTCVEGPVFPAERLVL